MQVRLNLHGVISVENAQQIEEEEYEETVKKAPAVVDAKVRCNGLLCDKDNALFRGLRHQMHACESCSFRTHVWNRNLLKRDYHCLYTTWNHGSMSAVLYCVGVSSVLTCDCPRPGSG